MYEVEVHTGFYGETAKAFLKLTWMMANYKSSSFKIGLDCPEAPGVELELETKAMLSFKDSSDHSEMLSLFDGVDELSESLSLPLQQIGSPFTDHICRIFSDERGEVVLLVRNASNLAKTYFYKTAMAKSFCLDLKRVLGALREKTTGSSQAFAIKMVDWFIATISRAYTKRWVATPRETFLSVSTSIGELEEFVEDFEAALLKQPIDRKKEWFTPIVNPIEIEARQTIAKARAEAARAFGKRVYEVHEKLLKEIDKKWVAEADEIREEFSDIPSISKLTPRK